MRFANPAGDPSATPDDNSTGTTTPGSSTDAGPPHPATPARPATPHARRLQYLTSLRLKPAWRLAFDWGLHIPDVVAVAGGAEPTAEVARAIDEHYAAAMAEPAEPPVDQMLVGERIKHERAKAGIKSVDLVNALAQADIAVSASRFSLIEAGDVAPEPALVREVGRLLRFNPEPYLGDANSRVARSLVLLRTILPDLWVGRSDGDRDLLVELIGTESLVPDMAGRLVEAAVAGTVTLTWAADEPPASICPRMDGRDGYPGAYREAMIGWTRAVLTRVVSDTAAEWYVQASLHRRSRQEARELLGLRPESLKTYVSQVQQMVGRVARSPAARAVALRAMSELVVPGGKPGAVSAEAVAAARAEMDGRVEEVAKGLGDAPGRGAAPAAPALPAGPTEGGSKGARQPNKGDGTAGNAVATGGAKRGPRPRRSPRA